MFTGGHGRKRTGNGQSGSQQRSRNARNEVGIYKYLHNIGKLNFKLLIL